MSVKQTVLAISLISSILKVGALPAAGYGDGSLGAYISLNPSSTERPIVSSAGRIVSTGIYLGPQGPQHNNGASLGLYSGSRQTSIAPGYIGIGSLIGSRPQYSNGDNLSVGYSSGSRGPARPRTEGGYYPATSGNLGLSLNSDNGIGYQSQANTPGTTLGLQIQASQASQEDQSKLTVKVDKPEQNWSSDTQATNLKIYAPKQLESSNDVQTDSAEVNSEVVVSPVQSLLSIQSPPVNYLSSTANATADDAIGSTGSGSQISANEDTLSVVGSPRSKSEAAVSLSLNDIKEINPEYTVTIEPIGRAKITRVASIADISPSVSSAVGQNGRYRIPVAQPQVNGRVVLAGQPMQSVISNPVPSSLLSLGLNSGNTPGSWLTTAVVPLTFGYSAGSGVQQNPSSSLNKGLSFGGNSGNILGISYKDLPVALDNSVHTSQNPQVGLTASTSNLSHNNPAVNGNLGNVAQISSYLTSGQGVGPFSGMSVVARPTLQTTGSGILFNPLAKLNGGLSLGGNSGLISATPTYTSPRTSHRVQVPHHTPQYSLGGQLSSSGLSSATSVGIKDIPSAKVAVGRGYSGNSFQVGSQLMPQNSLYLSTGSAPTSAGVSGNIEGSHPNHETGLKISSTGIAVGSQNSLNALLSPSSSSSLSIKSPAGSNSQTTSAVVSQNVIESSPNKEAGLQISSSGTSIDNQSLLGALVSPSASSSLSLGGSVQSNSEIKSTLVAQNSNESGKNANAALGISSSGANVNNQNLLSAAANPSDSASVSIGIPVQSNSLVNSNVGNTGFASDISIENQGSSDEDSLAENVINIQTGLEPNFKATSNSQTKSLGQSQLSLEHNVSAATAKSQGSGDGTLGLSIFG